MEKFTLIAVQIIEDDLQINVCLKPSSASIEKYIATYRVFENENIATTELASFIAEMTPLLFFEFQQMENVPLEIRSQFEL
jgi:hypothetical protein